jgi:uncharacterized protein YjbJ (UPF0337 family)
VSPAPQDADRQTLNHCPKVSTYRDSSLHPLTWINPPGHHIVGANFVRQRTDSIGRRVHPDVLDGTDVRVTWRVHSTKAGRALTGICLQEQLMSMNKDQVTGRVKEAKGTIKEVAGKLVGNESLEAKGKIQKTLGEAQAKFGDVKQDIKDAKKGV